MFVEIERDLIIAGVEERLEPFENDCTIKRAETR